MHRLQRLLFVPLVLVAAMVLPASTAAGDGYSNVVLINYCDGPDAVLKMVTKAAGYTPANRLTIDSWAQRKIPGGWTNVRTYSTAVKNFTANGENHSLTLRRTHTLPEDTFYYHRIKFRLRAWHNATLLASSSFTGYKCPISDVPF